MMSPASNESLEIPLSQLIRITNQKIHSEAERKKYLVSNLNPMTRETIEETSLKTYAEEEHNYSRLFPDAL